MRYKTVSLLYVAPLWNAAEPSYVSFPEVGSNTRQFLKQFCLLWNRTLHTCGFLLCLSFCNKTQSRKAQQTASLQKMLCPSNICNNFDLTGNRQQTLPLLSKGAMFSLQQTYLDANIMFTNSENYLYFQPSVTMWNLEDINFFGYIPYHRDIYTHELQLLLSYYIQRRWKNMCKAHMPFAQISKLVKIMRLNSCLIAIKDEEHQRKLCVTWRKENATLAFIQSEWVMQHTLSLLPAQVGTSRHMETSPKYFFCLLTDHHIKIYNFIKKYKKSK